jgi:hypothetical protein
MRHPLRAIRAIRAIPAAAALALLAACNSPESGTDTQTDTQTGTGADGEASNITITGENGETITATSNAASAQLPLGFTLYPGAAVVSNSTIATNDGKGSVLYFTTPASAADVAAFYRRQAEAAGIAIGLEQAAGETRTIAGEGPAGQTFMLTATPGEDGTGVQLMIGEQP